MSTTTILELSQRDADNVYENGDYKINLSKNISIKNGDIIDIKNVFVDTIAQSDQIIELDDDVVINTINGLYRTDWYSSGIANVTYPGPPTGPSPTGENYIVMTQSQKATVSEFDFALNDVKGGQNWGLINVLFHYIDYDTKKSKTLSVHVPEETKTNPTAKITVPQIELVEDSLVLATPKSTMDNANIKFTGSNEAASGSVQTRPALFSGSFVIPKGVYQPQEIAERISALFSENLVPNGTLDPLDSPFLKNINDIVGGATVECIKYNDKDIFANVPKSSNIFLGSNQVSLVYDSVEGKFNFNYMHFPLYDQNGNIQGGVQKKSNNTYFEANKNGGIYFTSITSQYLTLKQDIDLFGNIMGFDMNKLLIGLTDESGGYVYLDSDVQEGLSTSSGYVGIDALVLKNAKNSAYYAPTDAIYSTIDQTIPVKAEKSFNDVNQGGYFLIDIQANGYQVGEYIDKKESLRTISSVVSKYYSYKSYTVDQGTGSIPYQHIGNNFLLSGFRVRILDQNKNVAQSIGDDNTVILQIRKQLMEPQN